MVYTNNTKTLGYQLFNEKKCIPLHFGESFLKMCNVIHFMYIYTVFFMGNFVIHVSFLILYFRVTRYARQEMSCKYNFFVNAVLNCFFIYALLNL